MVELGDIIDGLETGVSVNSESKNISEGEFGILKTSAVTYGVFRPEEHKTILPEEIHRAKCNPRKDSIIISRMNTENLVGASAYVKENYNNLFLPDRLWQTTITKPDISTKFIHLIISSDTYREKISEICGGTSGSMKNISKRNFLTISIPIPEIGIQNNIVSQIEKEQTIVNANKQLIQMYEKKIKDRIAKVWGGPSVKNLPGGQI
jgi:restriction endonuclease S subunit